MTKELVKEVFDYGYNSYHECNSDLDYKQHLEDCYVSILDSEYENNNGWIKVESEEDLPKDGDLFWVIEKGYDYPLLEPMYHDESEYWIQCYTHYQPIVKPKLPIH